MQVKKNDMHNKSGPKETLLTKRETDIVILICKELSNKQIAGELMISQHTVETHKKSIRNKTCSCTAVGVALYAARNHIFLPVISLIISSFLDIDCSEIFSFGIFA